MFRFLPLLVCAVLLPTRALADAAPRIAGVAVDPAMDGRVLALVDSMLDAPTEHIDASGARGTDALVARAFATRADYVIVIDTAARRVLVIAPRDERMIERVLPADVVRTSPYAVALAACELLEALRDPTTNAPFTRVTAPRTPPRSETRRDAATPSGGPELGFRIALGPGYFAGLDAELDGFTLFGSAELDGRLGGARRWLLGLSGQGFGIERRAMASEAIRWRYARYDLALRGGIGRRFGPFALLGLVWAGLARIDAWSERVLPNGMIQDGSKRRVTGFVGLGAAGRIALGAGFSLGLLLGAEILPAPLHYQGTAGVALEEARVRLQTGIDVGFGR